MSSGRPPPPRGVRSNSSGRDRLLATAGGGGGSSSAVESGAGGGRDRLAEIRAAGVERVASVYNNSDFQLDSSAGRGKSGDNDPNSPSGILSEIIKIESDLHRTERELDAIRRSQLQCINAVTNDEIKAYSRQLKQKTDAAQREIGMVRRSLLAQDAKISKFKQGSADFVMLTNKQSGVKQKLQRVVSHFYSLTTEYSDAQKSRLLREMRVVNPATTVDDVDRMVSSGEVHNVFTSAVLQKRTVEARDALDQVTSRHEELRNIEQQATEIMQLMLDINTIIEKQSEMITQVEAHVETAIVDIEQGTKEVDTAIKHRKKSITCLWIACIVCTAIIIILGLYLSYHFGLFDSIFKNDTKSAGSGSGDNKGKSSNSKVDIAP